MATFAALVFRPRRPRRSGRNCSSARAATANKPRILEAFNEPIDNWLDFLHVHDVHDRDGKSQLMSLSESSLDPLARTTKFMLTEEAQLTIVRRRNRHRAHPRAHLPVDEDGRLFGKDVRKVGGIDIPTIQKHLNQWFA